MAALEFLYANHIDIVLALISIIVTIIAIIQGFITSPPMNIVKVIIISLGTLIAIFCAYNFTTMGKIASIKKDVVFLVDITRSTQNRNIKDEYCDTMKSFINKLKKDDTVYFTTITDNPYSNMHEKLVIPGYSIFNSKKANDQIQSAFNNDIEKDIENYTKADSIDTKGTDIIGAIYVANDLFLSQSNNNKIVYIFSDMIQQTYGEDKIQLNSVLTKEYICNYLDSLKTKNLIPDLHEVEVHICGATISAEDNSLDSQTYKNVKLFWNEYFSRANVKNKNIWD